MASAKVHFPVSATVVAIGLIPNMPMLLSSKNFLVSGLIMAFGFMIDADHISSLKPKKILDGSWARDISWKNYMHTWQFFLAVISTSIYIWNFLPLVSYAIHILIDSLNRGNRLTKKALLPATIHKFIPEWATYDFKQK